MAKAVQRLYDACKATFTPAWAQVAAPSYSLQTVRSLLDSIKPSDVGLDEEPSAQHEQGIGFFGMINWRKNRHTSMGARRAPPISYLHIHECDDFSMGIFCLPTSAVIPLHNHPGMTVLSKLLYGSMHVKAYDWDDPFADADPSQPRLAKLMVDQVISSPCEASVLYPTSGGNMHAFTAVTSCAVLDVLAPPYSAADGRHCTYYLDSPYSSYSDKFLQSEINDVHRSEQGLAWLEEFQPPDDFWVKREKYRGPRIMP